MRKFWPSLFLGWMPRSWNRLRRYDRVWREVGTVIISGGRPGKSLWRSWRHFQTYFASRSVSRLTGAPTSLKPRVVCSSVCGISATLNRSLSTSTSVRLTPSTATDPLLTICAASSAGQANQTVSHSPSATPGRDAAEAVDVALHEVPAEAVAHAQRAFEVDAVAGPQVAEVGAAQRLGAGLEGERGRRRGRRRSGRRR